MAGLCICLPDSPIRGGQRHDFEPGMAVQQLDGHISGQVRAIRAALVESLAYLEASLDFPEDEIPPLDVASALAQARQQLETLLVQAGQGLVYRQGVRTAIVGRPNVGKSSLLNALLRTERAIVTPVPGTTRDTVEDTLNLRGIPLCLVDTAGITASTDPVETLGIERSRQALQQADLVLLVLDGSEPLQPDDHALAATLGNHTTIVTVNKADLPVVADAKSILAGARHVHVSALTRAGLPELEDAIVDCVFSGQVQTPDAPLVSNPRHCQALRRALGCVVSAQDAWQARSEAELVAVELSAALSSLGDITGESAGEDVLEAIFSNFCIGK